MKTPGNSNYLLSLATALSLFGLSNCTTLFSGLRMSIDEAKAEILEVLNAPNEGIQPDGHSAIECANDKDITASRLVAELSARKTLVLHLYGEQDPDYRRINSSGITMTSGKSRAVDNREIVSCVRVAKNLAIGD